MSALRRIGPGIVVAATGLGAGDIVAAAAAGAQFGTVLLWAVILGGGLKFCLNEGLARWQLVTGKTLLEGWADHLPRIVSWYFLFYLLIWSFMVAAALMAATGLAAHALLPVLSVAQWGMLHSILAVVIVVLGGYRWLELGMKVFVGLMFGCVLICAVLVMPPAGPLFSGMLIPRLPADSLAWVLGIIGGVGGSVTVMSYGYWMQEAGWRDRSAIGLMRLDLMIAYGLTVLFGLGIIIVAAGVNPELASGNTMALAVADEMGRAVGAAAKWIFLGGFWGAVFSSMIGVWHGVPYLFADFWHYVLAPGKGTRQRSDERSPGDSAALRRGTAYRLYLLFMALPPMLLLMLDRPVWVVVMYAVAGAFFMPLLAGLLLYMNSRRQWLDVHANRLWSRLGLVSCLLLFGYLLVDELLGL